MIGRTVSHYSIIEKIGAGGMGEIYLAEDTKLERRVALKYLPRHLTADPEARQRFEREAKAAAALNHPNIVTVHEIGEHEGQVFIAMEYIEGPTLKELISSGRTPSTVNRLPISQVLEIAIQICSGLAAAHAKGIVHRDIKPQNILVDKDGRVKILDFGLAKLKGISSLTKESSTLGTVHYMSPEQAIGKEVDNRTDIWSLGVVLYEMLIGNVPFKGDYEQAMIYSILNEEPPKLKSIRPEVPPELEKIMARCLDKDPEKRYQQSDEIIVDIQAAQHHAARTNKARKQKLRFALIISTSTVLLSVAIMLFFFLPRKKADVGEKSIAVLPFVDMSPLKNQEYFCDGMTEELINCLSNIQALRVPARTSTFFFKGKSADIREVGAKLNVRTVLEGSVQKAGDRLRITAQLINVADGYHLWSEKYDRKLQDVFAIQDEISSAIVDSLQLKLTSKEAEKISEHPMDNVKAYDLYLKAARAATRFDEKSLENALADLQAAKDIMGDNAQLYAGMALVFFQYSNLGIQQEDYIEKARDYAQKALALQPDLSNAFITLGNLAIYEEYPKNLRDGIRYFQKALAVNPKAYSALYGILYNLFLAGRHDKSIILLNEMEREDPLNPRRYITRGFSYCYSCKFKPALEQFHILYQNDPTSPLAQNSYIYALAYVGQRDEALAVIELIGKESRNNVMIGTSFLLKYALLKDKENALRLITPEFRRTCWRDLEWSYWVGNTLALLGAEDEALDWLENAVNRGFINYPFMQCDPFLDNIRGEERFEKLMERAKYEWEHFEVPE